MTEYTLYGRVVLCDRVIEDGAVSVSDSRIVYAGDRDAAPVCGEAVSRGGTIMPGFVDIHCHAGGATWFYEDAAACAGYHLRHGTTTMCATLYRDLGIDGILSAIERIKAEMKKNPVICGVHIEGPYLNPELGARSSGGDICADPAEYMPILDCGVLRHMTYAPEVRGTEQLMRDLKSRGIKGSIGHSKASPDEVRRAMELGASNVTHIFDATGAAVSPTRWGGTIEADFNVAALVCDGFTYEIICDRDGVHVRPEMAALVKKCAGVENIIGITDACGGDGDGEDVNFLDGELNGSKLTMNRVAANFVSLGFTLPEAAAVTSLNPARFLSMENEIGSLEAGKRADIVVLDDDFGVRAVYKAKD